MGIFGDIGKVFDGAVEAVGDGANAFGKWVGDAVSTPFGESYREGDPGLEENIPYWFKEHPSYRILEVTRSGEGEDYEGTVRFKDGIGNEWLVKQDRMRNEEWHKWDDNDKQWREANFEGPLGRISQEQQEPPDPIVLTEDDVRGSPDEPFADRVLGGPTSIANPPADPMYTLPPPPEDPEPFVPLRKANLPPEDPVEQSPSAEQPPVAEQPAPAPAPAPPYDPATGMPQLDADGDGIPDWDGDGDSIPGEYGDGQTLTATASPTRSASTRTASRPATRARRLPRSIGATLRFPSRASLR